MTRRRMALGAVAAVVVVAIPFVANSCAGSREAAEAASQEFRMRVVAGAYDEIVRAATPEFQKATTEGEFAKVMDGIKERLGVWQSSEPQSWRVFAGTSERTVTLVYTSQFERGTATEEFVWRIRRGRPALAGYHVKSSTLSAQ